MTFTKLDTSATKRFDNGRAFEQLSMQERLAYFRKAAQIMKLKNAPILDGENSSKGQNVYHDDFFVYFGVDKTNFSRSVVALPRDVIKYAYYNKVSNHLHETLKEASVPETCEGNRPVLNSWAITKIISQETGIHIPAYYYDVDKDLLIMPFRHHENVVKVYMPWLMLNSKKDREGADTMKMPDTMELSTDKNLKYSDVPMFFYNDDMNVALFVAENDFKIYKRVMEVLVNMTVLKHFTVGYSNVHDEKISELLYEELRQVA